MNSKETNQLEQVEKLIKKKKVHAKGKYSVSGNVVLICRDENEKGCLLRAAFL